MFLVWATGLPDTTAEALERAVIEEIDGLHDVREAEVLRAVALSETEIVSSLERASERADLLSMYELFFSDPGRVNRELDRLRAVSPEQVRAYAADWLNAENRAVLTYEPGDAA